MLWSEQLSSPLISQSQKILSSRLLTTVMSMLLLPLRLWNVVNSLYSFVICRSLLIKYSSSVLPLEFVWLSCHAVDLELLSMAIRIPEHSLYCNISSIFVVLLSISSFMSRYILTARILVLLYLVLLYLSSRIA